MHSNERSTEDSTPAGETMRLTETERPRHKSFSSLREKEGRRICKHLKSRCFSLACCTITFLYELYDSLSSDSLFRHFDPTMVLSPVARPRQFLWYPPSARRCSAVTAASDRLVNETRVSGPDVFASYHPSSAVPDRGSFKSRLVAVCFPALYMKSPEVDITVHGANP